MTETSISIPTGFHDDDLGAIATWQDAVALLAREGVAVDTVSDYGHGFTLVKEKDLLIGKPMLLLEWSFNVSKEHLVRNTDGTVSGREFVSVYAVLQTGQKIIINDGGTGIYAQLRKVSDTRVANKHSHPFQGLAVAEGLTVSEYPYEDEKGNVSTARTYYLSESAHLTL